MSTLASRADAFYERLAAHAGLPFLDLAGSPALVDARAVRLLSSGASRSLGVLPLAFEEERLVVATAEPGDERSLQIVRSLTGRKLTVVVATPEDIDAARRNVFGSAPLRLVLGDRPRELPAETQEPDATDERRLRQLAEHAGLDFV